MDVHNYLTTGIVSKIKALNVWKLSPIQEDYFRVEICIVVGNYVFLGQNKQISLVQ